MDELVTLQVEIYDKTQNSFENFKKKGKAKMTKGATRAQIEKLDRYWNQFQENDRLIYKLGKEVFKPKHKYIVEGYFDQAEDLYYEMKGEFLDYLESFDIVRPTVPKVPGTAENDLTEARLPKINLPTFTGDYREWQTFRNLFSSLVKDRTSIPETSKLHYLQTSVQGEALDLIKNIPNAPGNFIRAWDKLEKHFENTRRLVNLHLTTLFSLEAVVTKHSAELKRILLGTTGPLMALEALGRPIKHWDDVITFLTYSKLDPHTREEWEDSLGNSTEPPSFQTFENFMTTKIASLQSVENANQTKLAAAYKTPKVTQSSDNFKSSSKTGAKAFHISNQSKSTTLKPKQKCILCSNHHYLNQCDIFRAQTVEQRLSTIKTRNLCYNCLGNHTLECCTSKYRCRECNKKHHSMLHFNRGGSSSITGTSNNHTEILGINENNHSSTGQTTPATHLTETKYGPESVLLATAYVFVVNQFGEEALVRAIIDQCSQSSFISTSLCQRLQLKTKSCAVPVKGLGNALLTTCKGIATFKIKPHFKSNFSCNAEAFAIPKVSSYRPLEKEKTTTWEHLNGLILADPYYNQRGSIEVLLGAAIHAQVVEGRVIKGKEREPIATESNLGWLISGETAADEASRPTIPTVLHCSAEVDVNDLLQKFWQQEEVTTRSLETPEEVICETHFTSSHTRTAEGRYVVKLPFRTNEVPPLQDTYKSSLKMLYNLEKRFARNAVFKEAYHSFMDDYIGSGHMTLVDTVDSESHLDTSLCCFLPHHGVLKESSSTTKLRTVFNGSMKTQFDVSLNDCLYTGANLLPDLTSLIIRWRKYKYAFTSDIKQMFRQIIVSEDDRRFQHILWRFDQSSPVQIYRLNTVTYGIVSSPFLANRVMRQLSSDYEDELPLGAVILKDEIYMDDILSGSHCQRIAREKQQQIIELCKVGGFILRKWLSNEPSLLNCLSRDLLAEEPANLFQSDEIFAVLGLHWLPTGDFFQFKVEEDEPTIKWTKRLVLSKVAKLFDPLGLLAPVIINAKIFLQKLWLLKLEWDDPLPNTELELWQNWYLELSSLSQIKIPRWLGYMPSPAVLQLHGFADASKLAYGAVLYLRTETENSIKVELIQAKSKVAPLKTLSIPKLELSAAHLLAKLVNKILPVIEGDNIKIYLWSDSLDSLYWLRDHPSKWPTFIANRCADIHNLVPDATWNHVKSEDNPADPVSRGIKPSKLPSLRLWWRGPPWLSQNQNTWTPSALEIKPTPSETTCHNVTCSQIADTGNKNTSLSSACTLESRRDKSKNIVKNHAVWQLLEDCSTLNRLLKITAYLLRFIDGIRNTISTQFQDKQTSLFHQPWFLIEKNKSKELSAAEVSRARLFWVFIIQHAYFSKEIELLKRNQILPQRHYLSSLNSILDQELLRVGGRLKHAQLNLDQKHPLILPSHGKFTEMVIRETHSRSLHGGVQLTLSTLRNQYWIIKGRQRVKSVIYNCIPCLRFKAKPNYQLMGNLPSCRVNPTRPFSKAGVDYAGPFYVRTAPGRGRTSYKGYICVFVCLSTKAVHLELVSSYDTEGFLAAFRRFCARRGHCSLLLSDQGTNFVGADAELKQLYEKSSDHCRKLSTILAQEGTTWRFNPPAAPHFGGIWEAAVKSTKHHIRRVIGEAKLTYEEFSTLLTQIESCLNSRPLTPMSDDSNDLQPLTPAHFLILSSSYIVPEPDYTEIKLAPTRRWQIVQQILQNYWKRWSQEYLQSLQRREKWRVPVTSVNIGDLVLVRSEVTPPAKWPLARVTEVYPGDDGLPRVVALRTASTTLKRPVTKIVMLRKEDKTKD